MAQPFRRLVRTLQSIYSEDRMASANQHHSSAGSKNIYIRIQSRLFLFQRHVSVSSKTHALPFLQEQLAPDGMFSQAVLVFPPVTSTPSQVQDEQEPLPQRMYMFVPVDSTVPVTPRYSLAETYQLEGGSIPSKVRSVMGTPL